MNDLIRELKNEHAALLAVLGEVKTLGVSSRTGQEKLLAARDLFLAHVRKEDESYYPELRKAAEKSSELKLLMDYFLSGMETVSQRAMRFFDRFAQGGDAEAFAGESKMLLALFKDRIRTEEETLFAKFPGKTGT